MNTVSTMSVLPTELAALPSGWVRTASILPVRIELLPASRVGPIVIVKPITRIECLFDRYEAGQPECWGCGRAKA